MHSVECSSDWLTGWRAHEKELALSGLSWFGLLDLFPPILWRHIIWWVLHACGCMYVPYVCMFASMPLTYSVRSAQRSSIGIRPSIHPAKQAGKFFHVSPSQERRNAPGRGGQQQASIDQDRNRKQGERVSNEREKRMQVDGRPTEAYIHTGGRLCYYYLLGLWLCMMRVVRACYAMQCSCELLCFSLVGYHPNAVANSKDKTRKSQRSPQDAVTPVQTKIACCGCRTRPRLISTAFICGR
jgi:hypothetical protein